MVQFRKHESYRNNLIRHGKRAPGIVDSDGGFDRYVPIDSSNVKYDNPALNNVDTDFLGDLNNNKDKVSLTSNMPSPTEEIKKETVNIGMPHTSAHIKLEPATAKAEELVNENKKIIIIE